MKYEQKIIEAAIEQIVEETETKPGVPEDSPKDAPPLGANAAESSTDCCAKPFSYRDLTKTARDMLRFSAANFNALFKEQGTQIPKIGEVKFIEFSFGAQVLVAKFKVFFEDREKYPEPGYVFANWNGNVIKVF